MLIEVIRKSFQILRQLCFINHSTINTWEDGDLMVIRRLLGTLLLCGELWVLAAFSIYKSLLIWWNTHEYLKLETRKAAFS